MSSIPKDDSDRKINRRELLEKAAMVAVPTVLFGYAGIGVGKMQDMQKSGNNYFVFDPSNSDHKKAYQEAMLNISPGREAENGKNYTRDTIRQFVWQITSKLHSPLVAVGDNVATVLGTLGGGYLGVRAMTTLLALQNSNETIRRRDFLFAKPTGENLALLSGGFVLGGMSGNTIGSIIDQQRDFGSYIVFDPSNELHNKAFEDSIAAVEEHRKKARQDGKKFTNSDVVGYFFTELSNRIEAKPMSITMTDGTIRTALVCATGGAIIGCVANALAKASPSPSH